MDKPARPLCITLQNKALAHGIAALTEQELLQLIGAPQRAALALPDALSSPEALRALKQSAIGEFSRHYRIGIGTACRLAVSLELGTRYWSQPLQPGQALNDPQQVRHWLRTELRDRQREIFGCLFLDARHRLIRYEELFAGGLDGAEVHPRIVVQQALRHQAAAVLLVHNHPSGHPEPSAADHALTVRLKQALALVDIRVLDHFIVAGNTVTSFAERGWL
ncbi:MAG: repair protein RadC [Pseudomonadota bacterium]